MKNLVGSAFFILVACAAGLCQQPVPTPPPNPAPVPTPTAPTPVNTRLSRMPSINSGNFPPGFGSPIEADPMGRRLIIVQMYAVPLYRKPTGKELRELAPDAALVAKYRIFLQRPDSGIFKLVPDAGCADNSKVVNASEQCLKYTIPGAANSFSFRTENYRIRHLADLTYSKGELTISGILMHGLMVDLGDTPLEGISLQSPKLKYIADFQPSGDFQQALEVNNALVRGVTDEGLLYRRSLPVVVGHTYVLRAVAYQGKVMKSVRGADYNELDFDKRRDVITAFRVVDIAGDGTVTIVWNTLRTLPSRKLKMPSKSDKEPLTSDVTGRKAVNQNFE